tara:strand:- start:15 stop:386 length:372 start_codon:yes stop_codon:yes gene_type:complete
MAHYAKVLNGIVTKVIVAEEDFFNEFVDDSPGKWIQTSYNTRGGVHYKPNSNIPSDDQSKALRKNYAGIDWIYDEGKDAFYPPQPYSSWIIDESTGWWKAPTPIPDDGNKYEWDETSKSWNKI